MSSHSLYEVEFHRDGQADIRSNLFYMQAIDFGVEMLGLGCWPVITRPMKRVDTEEPSH